MKNKIFIGNMSSGKTRSIFKEVDKLIENNESLFILDSKYEYVSKYYDLLKENEYDVKIIDLRNLDNSETFNPLTLPYKLYKEKKNDNYLDMLEKVIKCIVLDSTSIDPFWNNSAVDLIVGTILSLFYQDKIEEINFNSVVEIINSEKVKIYFEKFMDTPVWKYVSGVVNAPVETFGGIKSVALQKLRLYTTRENLSKFLSFTSFDYQELLDKKTAIIFINYDSTSIYNDLVNAFISEIYMYLENNLTTKFNFVLDNFDSLGYICDFKEMIGSNNSISFLIGVRDIVELDGRYHNLDCVANKIIANDEKVDNGEKINYQNKLVDKISVVDLSKFIDTKK